MEEHKFSNSNLDFNELFNKYKTLNTTYSDIDDFKINIYENCNLLQDLITTFTVPSTNIRLSSFKNNYIIADIQTLDLDQAFYDSNMSLFTTVENETYINNINLTNIITTYFDYANSNIYPSKKIIIKINLPKEIVDKNDSGALQIDMKEIKEHFHSLFDTLELDINSYVTGKHGDLENTNLQPSGRTGGRGQSAIVDSAGPAINIINNQSSYFNLIIKTNGFVSGGFGASGGNGGDGIIDETDWIPIRTEHYEERFNTNNYVKCQSTASSSSSLGYITWILYYWGDIDDSEEKVSVYRENTVNEAFTVRNFPASYMPSIQQPTFKDSLVLNYGSTLKNSISTPNGSLHIGTFSIKGSYYSYTKTLEVQPKAGTVGSKADYSNNANNEFLSSNGSVGTTNSGPGGEKGIKGDPGEITNITATNISIDP